MFAFKKKLSHTVFLMVLVASLFPSAASGAQAETREDPQTVAGEILRATGVQGGLVVHLGCDEGRLTASLHASPAYLVHGLDTSEAEVAEAQKYLERKGLYGKVSVDEWTGKTLPYNNNLVNLLVVEEPEEIPLSNMVRVLRPGGVAYVREKGKWTKTVKCWPGDVDEWSHYLHGPDNNAVAQDRRVGPPRHMQWLAGPRWTRHHGWLNSVSSAVTANGRFFYILDEATAADLKVPSKWVIVARDAFNGVRLWKKPMKSWLHHRRRFRSGPQQAPRLLVASEEYLYTPLSADGPIFALNAASGDIEREFAQSRGAEEIILTGDTLLVLKGEPVAEHAFTHPSVRQKYKFPNKKSIIALDIRNGKRLWQWSPEKQPVPETLASDGKNAYVRLEREVVCLDLQSGEERWRYQTASNGRRHRISYGRKTLVATRGVVLFNTQEKLTALSAKKGDKLWSCDAGTSFHAPLDIFVINGLVWQKLGHRMDPLRVPPDEREARDLYTGKLKVKDSVARNLLTPGHHYRCYRAKATERFIITGKRGVEMMDLDGSNHYRNNWVRGSCQYGILPANGFIYVLPHSCGCFMEAMLRGFWALGTEPAAGRSAGNAAPERSRLKKGPAYKDISSGGPDKSECWPAYRHDPLRSGVAGTEVSPKLKPKWRTSLGGKLTQPVVGAARVVVAQVDSGIVYGLNRENGEVLWSFCAGGRVDSPPTLYKGRVIFGTAAGRAICLRLTGGELVWRFLAAPEDIRGVALNRVESLWPVHGSVLLLNGVAYFSAGRSSWVDGGIYLYGLDPVTGKVLYQNRIRNRHPEYRKRKKAERVHIKGHLWTDYKTFSQPDRSDSFSIAGGISDVLVSDGENVFMRHLMFTPKLEKKTGPSRQLFSTFRLFDGAEHHRCDWGLGLGDHRRLPARRHKGGFSRFSLQERDQPAPYRSDNPAGLMLVHNGETVWGVQRRGLAKYRLFKKKTKSSRGSYIWKKNIPVRPRALLKSGSYLFLGVMPVEIPKDAPHAAYEGRLGGGIWVYPEANGNNEVKQYELESPVVWDGMAAAEGCLYISTEDGKAGCFSPR